MEYRTDNPEKLLQYLLEIGESMLTSGAEVNRVEETLTRMGRAYGAERMDVYVIIYNVIITMVFPDGKQWTQTRRILDTGGTDFKKLEALNDLSRRCCADPIPLEDLGGEIRSLCEDKLRRRYFYLGSMLGAGSFALFFGGSIWNGIAAALFAVLVCALQEKLIPICTNKMTFYFLCSLLSGICICLSAKGIPWIQADKVMIGDIMLLTPGIAMTNAVRDILVGNTISGIMRLTETLLWTGALACGFMIAIWLIGG